MARRNQKTARWIQCTKIVGVLGVIGISSTMAYAQSFGMGLIGGQDTTSGTFYAAQVAPNGTVTLLSGGGLSNSGIINSVAINSTGAGLIGGKGGGLNYAAQVAPNGTVTQLSGAPLSALTAAALSVAINDAGAGLISGVISNTSTPFVAQVAPNGTVTFNTSTGIAYSVLSIPVAINSSGAGLIGAALFSPTNFYAAQIASNGTLTPLSGLPSTFGAINSVAINSAGTGLIGGNFNFISRSFYAALVAPNGTVTQLTGANLSHNGIINSVAINSAGTGLIGGQDNEIGPLFYAALVAPNGTVTELTGANLSHNGIINSVAINFAGAGLIGGQDTTSSSLYAALVAPNGTVTELTGANLSHNGIINSVAINSAGVGLIGGQDSTNSTLYAALVAPNGTVTQLTGANLSHNGVINSVAINDGSNTPNAPNVVPQSIVSNVAAIGTQLVATTSLGQHLVSYSNPWNYSEQPNEVSFNDITQSDLTCSMNISSQKKPQQQKPKNAIWAAPFGDYIHLKKQQNIPAFTNEVGGVFVAYDHEESSNLLLGGGLGYAFNYIHYSEGIGHGKIQEEMASFYCAYQRAHFRLNGALWAGLYQLNNERHTLGFITSNASTHGFILSPHLELASAWAIRNNTCFVEPFVMFDWVNSWQRHFQETGSAGFNIVMKGQYASLLQSEAGLRFYEQWKYGWGRMVFEEKLSYINQVPFIQKNATTFFVGSASTFPIATGSSKVQNLGGVELLGSFVPNCSAYPYGGFSLQADLGSSYQSYFVSLNIGKRF